MSDLSPNTLPRNTIGALIFTAYVFCALFLTIFISRSLLIAYNSSPPNATPKNGNAAQSKTSSLSTRLLTYMSLSILSFSVLSYNMLSFLIVSYTAWAHDRHLPIPEGLLGRKGALYAVMRGVTGQGGTKVEIWEWLTISTLFQDFARDICDDWARYTWTSLALVGTMGVGLWMGREGHRNHIPHLWAYFAIGQILPISFAQNLFCIALLLSHQSSPSPSSPSPTPTPEPTTHPPKIALLLITFTTLIALTPFTIDTRAFIPLIIAIRLSLLIPLFIAPTLSQGVWTGAVLMGYACVLVGFGWRVGNEKTGLGALDTVRRVGSAVGDNYAVGALGWDFLVSVASAGLWLVGGGEG